MKWVWWIGLVFGTITPAAGEPLTFEKTQEWSDKYLGYTREVPAYLPADWRKVIEIPSPPANDSPETRKELEHLRDLQAKRTKEDEKRIISEIEIKGFRFGPHLYPDFTAPDRFPKTKALFDAANRELAIVVFTLKRHFNRVRPSFLDSRLKPCIEIPAHPAYPSGHATQAHVHAFLLRKLDPGKAAAIQAGARLIAEDRELAGVHYPSDTAAGIRLGRQIVDELMKNAEFGRLLDDAKQEW